MTFAIFFFFNSLEYTDKHDCHKLNITNRFSDRIIFSFIPSVIISVKSVMSPYDLSF